MLVVTNAANTQSILHHNYRRVIELGTIYHTLRASITSSAVKHYRQMH